MVPSISTGAVIAGSGARVVVIVTGPSDGIANTIRAAATQVVRGVDRLAQRAVGRVANAVIVVGARVDDDRRGERDRVDRGVVAAERRAVVGGLDPRDVQLLAARARRVGERVDPRANVDRSGQGVDVVGRRAVAQRGGQLAGGPVRGDVDLQRPESGAGGHVEREALPEGRDVGAERRRRRPAVVLEPGPHPARRAGRRAVRPAERVRPGELADPAQRRARRRVDVGQRADRLAAQLRGRRGSASCSCLRRRSPRSPSRSPRRSAGRRRAADRGRRCRRACRRARPARAQARRARQARRADFVSRPRHSDRPSRLPPRDPHIQVVVELSPSSGTLSIEAQSAHGRLTRRKSHRYGLHAVCSAARDRVARRESGPRMA